MIHRFLIAKHWQVFLLLFCIPMVLYIGMFASLFTQIEGNPDDTEFFFTFFTFMPFIMLLFLGTYFGWMWSIGVGIDRLLPEAHRLNITRFKIFLIYPLVYIVGIFLFMAIMIPSLISETIPDFNPMFILVIVPFHLFAIFCMLHNIYFTAKSLKTAELERPVKFSEFIGECFLMWFYPIGVWIIQPQLNKLIQRKNEEF